MEKRNDSNLVTPREEDQHINRAKDPQIVGQSQRPIGVIQTGFIVVALLLLAVYLRTWYYDANDKSKCQNAAGNYITIPNGFLRDDGGDCVQAPVQPVAQAQAQAARPIVFGQLREYYAFADSTEPGKCYTFDLPAKWNMYPKGKGAMVRIFDAETGKHLLDDEPGVLNKTKFDAGKYMFCPGNDKTLGIDILK